MLQPLGADAHAQSRCTLTGTQAVHQSVQQLAHACEQPPARVSATATPQTQVWTVATLCNAQHVSIATPTSKLLNSLNSPSPLLRNRDKQYIWRGCLVGENDNPVVVRGSARLAADAQPEVCLGPAPAMKSFQQLN